MSDNKKYEIICSTCLSDDRTTYHVNQQARNVLSSLGIKLIKEQKLCWECYATVRTIAKWQVLALYAVKLHINRSLNHIKNVGSLSKLSALKPITHSISSTTCSEDDVIIVENDKSKEEEEITDEYKVNSYEIVQSDENVSNVLTNDANCDNFVNNSIVTNKDVSDTHIDLVNFSNYFDFLKNSNNIEYNVNKKCLNLQDPTTENQEKLQSVSSKPNAAALKAEKASCNPYHFNDIHFAISDNQPEITTPNIVLPISDTTGVLTSNYALFTDLNENNTTETNAGQNIPSVSDVTRQQDVNKDIVESCPSNLIEDQAPIIIDECNFNSENSVTLYRPLSHEIRTYFNVNKYKISQYDTVKGFQESIINKVTSGRSSFDSSIEKKIPSAASNTNADTPIQALKKGNHKKRQKIKKTYVFLPSAMKSVLMDHCYFKTTDIIFAFVDPTCSKRKMKSLRKKIKHKGTENSNFHKIAPNNKTNFEKKPKHPRYEILQKGIGNLLFRKIDPKEMPKSCSLKSKAVREIIDDFEKEEKNSATTLKKEYMNRSQRNLVHKNLPSQYEDHENVISNIFEEANEYALIKRKKDFNPALVNEYSEGDDDVDWCIQNYNEQEQRSITPHTFSANSRSSSTLSAYSDVEEFINYENTETDCNYDTTSHNDELSDNYNKTDSDDEQIIDFLPSYNYYHIDPSEYITDIDQNSDNNIESEINNKATDFEMSGITVSFSSLIFSDNSKSSSADNNDTSYNSSMSFETPIRCNSPDLLEPLYFTNWQDRTFEDVQNPTVASQIISEQILNEGENNKMNNLTGNFNTQIKTSLRSIKTTTEQSNIKNKNRMRRTKKIFRKFKARTSNKVLINKNLDYCHIYDEKLSLTPIVLLDKIPLNKMIKRNKLTLREPVVTNPNILKTNERPVIDAYTFSSQEVTISENTKGASDDVTTTTVGSKNNKFLNQQTIGNFDETTLNNDCETGSTVKDPNNCVLESSRYTFDDNEKSTSDTNSNEVSINVISTLTQENKSVQNKSKRKHDIEETVERKPKKQTNLLRDIVEKVNTDHKDPIAEAAFNYHSVLSKYESNNVLSDIPPGYTIRFLGDDELKDFRTKCLYAWQKENSCDTCVVTFSDLNHLKIHLKRYHRKKAGHLKCTICQCRFKNRLLFKWHSSSHKIVYKCCFCNEEYLNFLDVSIHLMQEHGKGHQRTYKCFECHKIYRYISSLASHISRLHSAPKKIHPNLQRERKKKLQIYNANLNIISTENDFEVSCNSSNNERNTNEKILSRNDLNEVINRENSSSPRNDINKMGENRSPENSLNEKGANISFPRNDLNEFGINLSLPRNDLNERVINSCLPENNFNVMDRNSNLPENSLNEKCRNPNLPINEMGINSNLTENNLHEGGINLTENSFNEMAVNLSLPRNNLNEMPLNLSLPKNNLNKVGTSTNLPENNFNEMALNLSLPRNNLNKAGIYSNLPGNDLNEMSINLSLPRNSLNEVGINSSLPENSLNEVGIKSSLPENSLNEVGINSSLPENSLNEVGIKSSLPENSINEKCINSNLPENNINESGIYSILPENNSNDMNSRLPNNLNQTCSFTNNANVDLRSTISIKGTRKNVFILGRKENKHSAVTVQQQRNEITKKTNKKNIFLKKRTFQRSYRRQKCNICNKLYKTMGTLLKHQTKFHINKTLNEETAETCPESVNHNKINNDLNLTGDHLNLTVNHSDSTGNRSGSMGNRSDSTDNRSVLTGNRSDSMGNRSDSTDNRSVLTGNRLDSTGNRSDSSRNRSDSMSNRSDSTGDRSDSTGNHLEIMGNRSDITDNSSWLPNDHACSLNGISMIDERMKNSTEPYQSSISKHICVVCQREYVNSSSVIYHQRQHHTVNTTTNVHDIEKKSKRRRKCKLCKKLFLNKTTLQKHYKTVHYTNV